MPSSPSIGVLTRASTSSRAKGVTSLDRPGLEADDVSWAAQQRYAADWFAAAELVPTTGLVEVSVVPVDAGFEEVMVVFSTPIATGGPQVFMRLEVTLSE